MTIHVSAVGTYHPPKGVNILGQANTWTINDTRGYLDAGPSCSECGACECIHYGDGFELLGEKAHEMFGDDDPEGCVGLSFAYVNMDDGAESLCENCATKAEITIVPCDCN